MEKGEITEILPSRGGVARLLFATSMAHSYVHDDIEKDEKGEKKKKKGKERRPSSTVMQLRIFVALVQRYAPGAPSVTHQYARRKKRRKTGRNDRRRFQLLNPSFRFQSDDSLQRGFPSIPGNRKKRGGREGGGGKEGSVIVFFCPDWREEGVNGGGLGGGEGRKTKKALLRPAQAEGWIKKETSFPLPNIRTVPSDISKGRGREGGK